MEKKDKSKDKIRMKQLVIDTRSVFARCVGVLFVYTLMFDFFEEYIFLPVSRKLWSLSLLTVKEGYISDQNIISLFTHPLVLLAGLFAVAGYSFLCLWDTAGITMIIEYSYRNEPVRFFRVIPESFKQIKHCLLPKNWVIFVYLLIIQPLIDDKFAGQMFSSFTVPEYIMDYILARIVLCIGILLFLLIVFIFFVRYLFLPMIMILEKKDFREASKKSVSFLKGRFTSTYRKIISSSLIGSLLISIVPYMILFGLFIALTVAFSKYEYASAVGIYIFFDIGIMMLATLRTCFVKLFVSAMLLVTYHLFESQLGNATEIVIPEKCVKKSGKIYSFKRFIYGLYAVIFVALTLLFAGMVTTAETDPMIISDIINSTKIAAHKGYSSKAPENTMPAFELAAENNVVDYIELDIRETKDGVPVVIHDASIKAATGENILVYDLTYDELQKYSAKYGFVGSEFDNNRIPSLDEVLAEYSGKKNFIIEIKADKRTPQLPEKIVRLMEKYDITKTSMIHSGSYESLKAVKEINPNIKCGFIVAVSMGGYEDLPYADFFSVEHTYLSSNVINKIHQRDKEVFVWTVNDESSFKSVRNMGVDAVITDYPDDAYWGMHQYDKDAMEMLFSSAGVSSYEELNEIRNGQPDLEGTGD